MKTLYPEIDPFQHFFLQTESQHTVYVEQSGNRQGLAVIFLHGGPCSGCKPDHRRFFNPKKYHIILMDQRGCGQSLPFGELEKNTTQELIDDMEKIRTQLNIDKWLLFGGSWGGTLALLYTLQHKRHTAGMVIRGVFLARKCDMNWFAIDGARRIYPEKWQQLVASVPQTTGDLIQDVYDAVFGEDEVTQRRVAKAWSDWGGQVALMQDFQDDDSSIHVTKKMLQQVQMEMHYAQNNYFIDENQILNECDILQHIPTIIIHGRNDLVCPLEAGMRLSQVLPHAEYNILPNSGHIASGAEMIDALVDATDKMIELIQ